MVYLPAAPSRSRFGRARPVGRVGMGCSDVKKVILYVSDN